MKTLQMHRNAQGFSLIELMITVLLSSILLIGVLELFSNVMHSDQTNTAVARMQESGRVALELIKSDVRRANYQGCAASSIETRTGSAFLFPRDSIGKQGETAANGGVSEGAGTASDVLTLRYASPTLIDISSVSSSTLSTTNAINFSTAETFLLTDCFNVVIFHPNAAGSNANSITTAESNFSGMTATSTLFRVRQVTYQICASGRGLCRDAHDGSGAQEVIADAENFQVLYGLKSGSNTKWINADSLTDALRASVNQIQVSLVVASPRPAEGGTSTESLPIANIGSDTTLAAANDKLVRRVFNSTIDIRNR